MFAKHTTRNENCGVFRVATCFDVEEWFQQMLERSVQADCKLRRVPKKTTSPKVSSLLGLRISMVNPPVTDSGRF